MLSSRTLWGLVRKCACARWISPHCLCFCFSASSLLKWAPVTGGYILKTDQVVYTEHFKTSLKQEGSTKSSVKNASTIWIHPESPREILMLVSATNSISAVTRSWRRPLQDKNRLTVTLLLWWVALLTWVLLLRWVALLLGRALLVWFLLLAVLGITFGE